MTAGQYNRISKPFRKNRDMVLALNLINLILTIIVYIAYPSLLIYLFVVKSEMIYRAVLVPASMFIFVSGLRKIINRKRPYEALNIKPLINKDKHGESMPSRHIFSVFIIAMTFLYFKPLLSIPFFVIGVLLAVVRFVGGVHYLSDILVGAAIGIVSGIIGFYII